MFVPLCRPDSRRHRQWTTCAAMGMSSPFRPSGPLPSQRSWMPAADAERELHQRLVLILGQIFQHLRTQNGVGVEDGGLLRRRVKALRMRPSMAIRSDVVEGRPPFDEAGSTPFRCRWSVFWQSRSAGCRCCDPGDVVGLSP